jgi:hypothetical protein
VTLDDFKHSILSNGYLHFREDATPADRRISGEWLAELAASDVPLRIKGAVVDGPIVLETIVVKANFELIDCKIHSIEARYATFEKWFRIETSSFAGDCTLRGVLFNKALWLRGCEINGALDLTHASVLVDVNMDRSISKKRSDLTGLSVQNNFHLRQARLVGPFEMPFGRVAGQFDATDAIFEAQLMVTDAKIGALVFNKVQALGSDICFDRCSIDAMALFVDAVFTGPATFSGMSVKGQVVFNGAAFHSDFLVEGTTANDFVAQGIRIAGTCSLVGSHIFSCDLGRAQLSGTARFNDLHVDVTVNLSGASFGKRAIFDRLQTGETMRVAGSADEFVLFGSFVSFAGARIGSQGVFEFVLFQGSVVFEGASFGADLYFESCKFSKVVSAVDMRIGKDLVVTDSEFSEVMFHAAQCRGNIGFATCTFADAADFSYIQAKRNLVFVECSFKSELILKNAHISGELAVRESTLSVALSLEMATCGVLHLFPNLVKAAKVRRPDLSSIKVNAIGLRYAQVYVVVEDFLAAIDSSRLYVLDPYSQLERHLRRVGQQVSADDVYVRGRRHLRATLPKVSLRYWLDSSLEVLSGYGVKPVRTFVALLSLFAVTALLICFVPHFASHTPSFALQLRPNIEVAANLALKQYSVDPGGSVAGWSISECPLWGAWVRPPTILSILRLLGVLLIPFVATSFFGVLKYVGSRE